MKCLICRDGMMHDYLETYLAQYDDCYVFTENVRCCKCDQCSGIVYPVSALEALEDD